ncbi:MAG: DUF427 domain-containing protein [Rhodothalassiaceae bacterium]
MTQVPPRRVPLPDHAAILDRVGGYRDTSRRGRPAQIEQPQAGQRSVWDFPRPPAVEQVPQRVRVVFAGETIADSRGALRIIETAGAPVYYLPPADVRLDCLDPTDTTSLCEWKGVAVYFDVRAGGRRAPDAAFSYPDPLQDLGQGYERVADYVGFYAQKMDACYVGDEQVVPQPGGFYAGWVSSDLTGPIKGEPGSEGW